MWCINPSLQRWMHNWESSGTTAIDTQRCGKKALLFCGGISPHPWILWAHWIVSWIWKWCESYAMAFSQSPDLNPTEHLWINLDWHVWQRSCRVIQSQCIFKHLTKTLCVAFSLICHPSICSNVNSCFNDITDEKVKQSVLLFYLLLSFSQLPSSFSLSLSFYAGILKELKWRLCLLVTCLTHRHVLRPRAHIRTCKHSRAHMQTCMSCSERKWREKERRRWGETQRERSPSPSAVMDYTSPFLPHTLPPPLSKVGVCKPGVCHITSTALTHVVLEVCMCVEGGVAVVVHCDAEWEPSRKYCVCVCACDSLMVSLIWKWKDLF